MIIIKKAQTLKNQSLAATVGFFDGVHLGHRFLIKELKEIARKQNLPTAVVTFPEHPRSVLHADYQPKLLNSFEEKIAQLATTGIDYCIILPFTPELSYLSAQEFICNILHKQFHVQTLLIGYDHRFGHNRTDGFEQYVQYGKECNVNIIRASVFNEGKTAVSSSEIRKLLVAGKVEEVHQLLTYPYSLKGTIVSGYQVGRTIGFPTANIHIEEPYKVIPRMGVYAVWVLLDNKKYKGMLYIGNRPTCNPDDSLSIEVNIFDFFGDIYNKEIEVIFEYYVRDNIKFNDLNELKQQLFKDRATVIALLTKHS